MISLTLPRSETSDQGTFGRLQELGIYTAELPWRDNKPGLSCIPEGDYTGYLAEPWNSRRFPQTYHILDVPDRSAILIHQGNLAGDKSKGYLSHVLGCIIVGKKRGWIGGQKAVLLSVVAMRELRKAIGRNPFRLRIINNF